MAEDIEANYFDFISFQESQTSSPKKEVYIEICFFWIFGNMNIQIKEWELFITTQLGNTC